MKLYHHPFSSNARKVTVAAALLEVPLELEFVNLALGAQRTPEYLKLNPNGKVPTLVDGNVVLWESVAIMMYLADKKGDTSLYPKELVARADVNRWLFWSAAHFHPPIATLNFENMLKRLNGGSEGPDPVRVAQAEGEIASFGKVIDGHLAEREFVSGKGITLADIAIACALMTTAPAKLPVTGFKNLQRWFAQIQALPAWKATEPPPTR